jgi:hypothetical protein
MKIKTDLERKTELHNCIAWAGIWLMMLYCLMYSTGCSNWQGMEFRVGVGQYNGAQETKTFTKEDTKQDSKKY